MRWKMEEYHQKHKEKQKVYSREYYKSNGISKTRMRNCKKCGEQCIGFTCRDCFGSNKKGCRVTALRINRKKRENGKEGEK